MKLKNRTIWFDMDGTLVKLYDVPNWLNKLKAEDSSPYRDAKPCLNFNNLSKVLNKLQDKGFNIGVISYLPPKASKKYNLEVKKVKANYLKKYFPNVKFNEIHLVNYGIPKHSFAQPKDILFDDDILNRKAWRNIGIAYTQRNILKNLERY